MSKTPSYMKDDELVDALDGFLHDSDMNSYGHSLVDELLSRFKELRKEYDDLTVGFDG